MKSPEEKRAAQAAAHKKWRQSPKYQEYKLRQKMKKAGVKSDQVNDTPSQSA
jgi:hypothetical protein